MKRTLASREVESMWTDWIPLVVGAVVVILLFRARRQLRVVLIPRPCAGFPCTAAKFQLPGTSADKRKLRESARGRKRETTMVATPRQGFPSRPVPILSLSLLLLSIVFSPVMAVETVETVGFSEAVARALRHDASVGAAGFDLEIAKRDVEIARAFQPPQSHLRREVRPQFRAGGGVRPQDEPADADGGRFRRPRCEVQQPRPVQRFHHVAFRRTADLRPEGDRGIPDGEARGGGA